MKNKLFLLTLIFAGLVNTQTTQAYWQDEYGNEHYGVVSNSVYVADDVVSDTGYALGDLFGVHRHHDHYRSYPSDHHCNHHPYDPAC